MNEEHNDSVVVSHFESSRRGWLLAIRQFKLLFAIGTPILVLLIAGGVYALTSNNSSPRNQSVHLTVSKQSGQTDNSASASKDGTSTTTTTPSPSPSSTNKPSSTPSSSKSAASSQTSSASISSSSSSSSVASSSGSGGSSSTGTTIWTGNFESGTLSGWTNQSCPTGVTIVNNPVRDGSYAAAFTVTDQSTNAYCKSVPTSNPRAQLVSPFMFGNNSNYYIGFSTYFPTSFPTTTSWFQFAEIYGPPYGGSPSMGFDVKGNNMTMDRDPTHNYDTIWTSPSPIDKGTWEDIIVHVDFSTDPTVGYVELWLNGVPQTFSNGSTRIYYDTLVSGVNWNGTTPNALYLNQYRNAAVSMGSVTIYHDAARVGTSYDSVLP